MKTDHTLRTRREFLRGAALGGAFAWTIPGFLADTFSSLAVGADRATQAVTGRDGRILVVLQMAGGNDGLNSVVPWRNDYYHRARPRLGLGEKQILKLNDDLGLHTSLAGFRSLFDAGELSVIQGVGYPNPNRSHFRSTEIWQTASDAGKIESHGWLGRYFDHACSGCDPTAAVNVGRQMPQAFASRNPKGISLESPQNYRFISHEGQRGNSQTEESYRKLNESDELEMAGNSGGTIDAIGGTMNHPAGALDFLERTALNAQVSSEQVRSISSRVQTQGAYPTSSLGNSLKLVAQLIGGGLPTRIFYVSQGGYDTHTNQVNTHERLLRELGDSVKAFTDDMKAQGNHSRVLLMTFSEFGRRVGENASGGTDHGAAAPMFFAGGKVQAGLHGKAPSLAPGDLFQGDLKYSVDFRSVYAGVLEQWLETPSAPVLGRKFEPFQVV